MKKLSQNLFQQGIDDAGIKQIEEMLKQMNMPQMEIDKVIQPLQQQMQQTQVQKPQQMTTQPMQQNQQVQPISRKVIKPKK